MIFDALIRRYNTATGGLAEKWRELMCAIGDLVALASNGHSDIDLIF
jgi:hypothetical protein